MRRHPHLFEISTWPWLERLSRREGRRVTLGSVPDAEWDRIAQLGFDCVFLMGVWRRSALGRFMARTDRTRLDQYDRALPGWSFDDVCGSPYSIQAYEPDERMGGWDDLARARDALASRNIRLILDFVPNHTGLDHPWVRSRPDLYVQGTLDDYRDSPELFHPVDDDGRVRFVACGRDPFFPAWQDVAQLNYFNPETRAVMVDTLAGIAERCDGVRCDMAMLVLNDVFERTWRSILRDRWAAPRDEFWPAAIARVPGLLYLAEVYWDREWSLQQQGFHFTYDKRLLDRLHQGSTADVRAHLATDRAFSDRLVRFLENHDEERSAAVFGARLPAAATLAATLPGMRFFFDGQLEGRRVRAPVQLARWSEEPVDAAVADRYERLLRAASMPALHDGEWTLHDVASAGDATFGSLVAYSWRWERDWVVVAANLSASEAQGLVHIDAPPDGAAFTFRDQLSDESYRWDREDLRNGLYVRLPGGRAHFCDVQRA